MKFLTREPKINLILLIKYNKNAKKNQVTGFDRASPLDSFCFYLFSKIMLNFCRPHAMSAFKILKHPFVPLIFSIKSSLF